MRAGRHAGPHLTEGAMMKLWVDDERPAPEGWVWAKRPTEAISALATGEVSELSLDHDLGIDPDGQVGDELTTRPIVMWMCEMDAAYPGQEHWPGIVHVHSQNPVGREWLLGMIERYKPTHAPVAGEQYCPVNWRSHGCYLPPDHDGPHVCDPCPTGCASPRDEDGDCERHCNDRSRPDDNLY